MNYSNHNALTEPNIRFQLPDAEVEKRKKFSSQIWHRKKIRPGSSGDIVFFRELEDKLRESNALAAGQIPVREEFLMKKLILRFNSTDNKNDVYKLMDKVVMRIHIEGDDCYRFVRPTKINHDFEFVYEAGDIPLGAGQSFCVIMHFSSSIETVTELNPTLVIQGIADKPIY